MQPSAARTLVSPEEALQIVLANLIRLPTETISVEEALGRILARDIASPLDLPPFDNSAVDGYALHVADVTTASTENPAVLLLQGTTAAGDVPLTALRKGAAVKVMTGAPVPPGTEAVVMREDTREGDNVVEVLESARPGQSIRRQGSDVLTGEVVLKAGSRIRAAEWGMLASLGQAHLEVFRRPRVGIITTGAELKGVEEELDAGQIRDSNSWTLRGLLRDCGAEALHRTIGDDPQALKTQFEEMFQSCDAIVTSGGVSMGDFDPVRDVLPTLANVHFWKIRIKPGKPVMFASHQDGERTIPIWGLPGNPVSVMVSFEEFVRPALLTMGGHARTRRATLQARMLDGFSSPPDRAELVRAFVEPDPQQPNEWVARTTGDQGSGRLSTMTRANALLVVPESTTRVEIGDHILARMTDWPEIG